MEFCQMIEKLFTTLKFIPFENAYFWMKLYEKTRFEAYQWEIEIYRKQIFLTTTSVLTCARKCFYDYARETGYIEWSYVTFWSN